MTMHPLKNEDSEKSDENIARAGFDGGDGGGYDGSMRERVTRLEAFAAEALRRFDRIDARFDRVDARFDHVDARFERIEAQLRTFGEELAALKQGMSDQISAIKQEFLEHRIATKHDIDNAIRWIVGMMLAISMAAITIVTFVLNYATPQPAPAVPVAAQPIVIYATAPPPGQASAPPRQ